MRLPAGRRAARAQRADPAGAARAVAPGGYGAGVNALAHYHPLVARLLRPDGDVGVAVAGFVAPLAAESPEGVEGLLEVAWDLVVVAAEGAPASAQGRLVELVGGLQRYELPGVRVWAQRVLTDLPMLGDRLSRAWEEPRDAESWVRLNAFAARLTGAVADYLPLGLRTIAAGLEGRGAVAPAVEWFRYAGEPLLAASLHGRTYAGRLGDARARAEGGFSVARWTGWRGRLEELAKHGDPVGRDGFRLVSRFDGRVARHYR